MKINICTLLSFALVITSCTTTKVVNSESHKFELKDNITVDGILELNSNYVIYPSAKIKTIGSGKVIIKEPITILGKTQVFDENINIEFKPGTLSEIYPTWFGAKGYDNLDDTKAIKKTLKIAKEYESSINIMIPIGLFQISEILTIESEVGRIKSINLIGNSMSQSSLNGSSFLWTGVNSETMFLIKNINLSRIENIDFRGGDKVKNNLELRPSVYQYLIKNSSFKGCIGKESANINLNRGSSIQVSEIQIENCTFHGVESKPGNFITESAIAGGLANTKNFYIKNCAFMGYTIAAVNIEISDVLVVENSTFAHNDIDIVCLLCNTYAKSNYSEWSKAFFKATSSNNASFTYLIGNYFDGQPTDGYVIRDGAGSLVLINNNFGGSADEKSRNYIKWENKPLNTIYSLGNYFSNLPINEIPFYDRSNQIRKKDVISTGDIGGKNAEKRSNIKIDKN